jgi:hypothetical protein
MCSEPIHHTHAHSHSTIHAHSKPICSCSLCLRLDADIALLLALTEPADEYINCSRSDPYQDVEHTHLCHTKTLSSVCVKICVNSNHLLLAWLQSWRAEGFIRRSRRGRDASTHVQVREQGTHRGSSSRSRQLFLRHQILQRFLRRRTTTAGMRNHNTSDRRYSHSKPLPCATEHRRTRVWLWVCSCFRT